MSAVGAGRTGHSSGQDTPPSPAPVRHLARHQVMGLASVFLLGMAVNLIGLPSQTSGVAHPAGIAFLAAHALIALGLVIGTLLLRAAARMGGRWRRQATAGAAAIAVAVAAGILTVPVADITAGDVVYFAGWREEFLPAMTKLTADGVMVATVRPPLLAPALPATYVIGSETQYGDQSLQDILLTGAGTLRAVVVTRVLTES